MLLLLLALVVALREGEAAYLPSAYFGPFCQWGLIIRRELHDRDSWGRAQHSRQGIPSVGMYTDGHVSKIDGSRPGGKFVN